jgi:phosphate-selective porin OprO and OprP
MNTAKSLLAIGLGALLAAPMAAQEDLRACVEELEQQLKILKRQLELDKEASTEKSKSTPVLTAGASGFSFRSADTNFVLKLRGYLHVDGRFYPDDVATGKANDTFLLRRVRPIIEGTLFEKFDYRLMLDFGSGASLSGATSAVLPSAGGQV